MACLSERRLYLARFLERDFAWRVSRSEGFSGVDLGERGILGLHLRLRAVIGAHLGERGLLDLYLGERA